MKAATAPARCGLRGRPMGPAGYWAVAAGVALAMALPQAADARARPALVAQLVVVPQAQPRIESAPSGTVTIESAPAAQAVIQPRPRDDQPRILPPPVSVQSLVEPDATASTVDKALKQLMQTAGAPRNIGGTAASAQAAWQLGLIYLHGAGMRRDAALAQRWFEQAARFNREPWAFAGLAWCHIDGCVGPPDAGAAARAIAQLRARQPARAQYLEWVLATRQTPLQVASPGLVESQTLQLANRRLLEKASAMGDMHANIELGIDAAAHDRVEEAEVYFRRAGPNSLAAHANLHELASRNARPGAEAGSSPAPQDAAEALTRARKYHRGEGVPANFAEAIRFYRLADAKGSVEAKRMLALINSRPATGGGINPGWMQQLAYVDARTSIPTVGIAVSTVHMMHREPTPLYDLMPPFWRRQLTMVSR
ncbi:MAG: hypothetical protein QM772_00620 [Ottowia sp.]|uniref:tetratricopeptide repeat protein n=1 Tax=Ottowia sp. TaxID=1898956 RepID=UPI0039E33DC5